MDPNVNLVEQRRLAARIIAAFDSKGGKGGPDRDSVSRLAELVEALDGWLSKGGALPAAWRR
jgi:hypothetical protein